MVARRHISRELAGGYARYDTARGLDGGAQCCSPRPSIVAAMRGLSRQQAVAADLVVTTRI
jgi:hypothetical protein